MNCRKRKPRVFWVVIVNGHTLWAYTTRKQARKDNPYSGVVIIKSVEVVPQKRK